jgi:hypothetical protein
VSEAEGLHCPLSKPITTTQPSDQFLQWVISAQIGNGLDFMAKKLLAQSAWNALVKQHAHQQSSGPSPARGQQQQFLA